MACDAMLSKGFSTKRTSNASITHPKYLGALWTSGLSVTATMIISLTPPSFSDLNRVTVYPTATHFIQGHHLHRANRPESCCQQLCISFKVITFTAPSVDVSIPHLIIHPHGQSVWQQTILHTNWIHLWTGLIWQWVIHTPNNLPWATMLRGRLFRAVWHTTQCFVKYTLCLSIVHWLITRHRFILHLQL